MRSEVENAVQLLRAQGPAHKEQALELLQNTVFSFSMRLCGHREDAEDTAQEVLLKAIPYLERFDNAKALASWLYTVARNRCWMSRRRSKFAPDRHLSLEELMPDAAELDHLAALAADSPSPEQKAMHAEDTERLKQAILMVPPKYRLVLVLHDVEDLSTEQIAAILGIREGNVRVRLHRARLLVRKELARVESKAEEGPPTLQSPPAVPRRPGRCKQVFSNLSNYLDGVLDDSLCQELERHMTGCKPCQAFLASLQNTIDAIRRLPTEELDPQTAAASRSRALQKLAAKSAH